MADGFLGEAWPLCAGGSNGSGRGGPGVIGLGSAAPGLVPVGELGGISVPRETDGQASGGSDSGDWIFTIREKDPKNLENGTLQPSDLERNKVPHIQQPVALGNPHTIRLP